MLWFAAAIAGDVNRLRATPNVAKAVSGTADIVFRSLTKGN
jgi:hypothetical protein